VTLFTVIVLFAERSTEAPMAGRFRPHRLPALRRAVPWDLAAPGAKGICAEGGWISYPSELSLDASCGWQDHSYGNTTTDAGVCTIPAYGIPSGRPAPGRGAPR
jgi:hypothetical protein